MNRQHAFELMCEYTKNEALRRHMLSVEIAMRAYAEKHQEDVEKWGIVGLLHDFDYERFPTAPDHPLEGSKILEAHGYPADVITAIKSHVAETGVPRTTLMDKSLFACDELSGFITAVALVRPEGIHGMKPKSVRKKLKQKSFAEKVNRQDITDGAEELGVDLNEHIQFVIDAFVPHAAELKLEPA